MSTAANPGPSGQLSLISQVEPQTNRGARLARLATLASAQSGVLARSQLREVGWTDGQVDHEIRFGRWHAPAHGVVALQNAVLSYEQRLWLGTLHRADEPCQAT